MCPGKHFLQMLSATTFTAYLKSESYFGVILEPSKLHNTSFSSNEY